MACRTVHASLKQRLVLSSKRQAAKFLIVPATLRFQVVARVQPLAAPPRMPKDTDLWARIRTVYSTAEEKGALQKINTQPEMISDSTLGLQFQLQVLEALKDKPKAKEASGTAEPEDVFATPDEDLSVDQELTATHMLRLNKFNVVPYHTLVVTRDFAAQTAPLTAADWEATWRVVQAYPEGALAYFNGGENSGSSQPRKHTQIVPLAVQGTSTAPRPFEQWAWEAWKVAGRPQLQAFPLRQLPFQSFSAALPRSVTAADLQCAYESLMASPLGSAAGAHYNVLATTEWMLLVPRRRESYGVVGCNALVFAGTMLVRSVEELDFIRTEGPVQILGAVTFPWEP